MMTGTLGIPLLPLSAWCAIPALLFVAVTLVRTRLEDAVLDEELAGYRDYISPLATGLFLGFGESRLGDKALGCGQGSAPR